MANNEELETRMDIARMKLDSDDQKKRRQGVSEIMQLSLKENFGPASACLGDLYAKGFIFPKND